MSRFARLGSFESNVLHFLARQRAGRWSKVQAKHQSHEAFARKAVSRLWRLGLVEESGGFIRISNAGKEVLRGDR